MIMDQLQEVSKPPSRSDIGLGKARDHRSLVTLRKSRRQIESDAQALANRIALLQKEEIKLVKNIAVANSKAQEFYVIKKREADRSRETRTKLEESNTSWQYNQSNSMVLRKQRENNIYNLKEAMQKQKHKEMLAIKRQSEICRIKKQDLEERIKSENRSRMLHVKKDEIMANLKKRSFFEEKLQRVKVLQMKKLQEEEDYRISKELEVMNLEKIEMDLVQRIQQTKVVQKQVYKNLESMLTTPIVEDQQYASQVNPMTKTGFSAEFEPIILNQRARSVNQSVIQVVEGADEVMRTQLRERPYSKGSAKHQSFLG